MLLAVYHHQSVAVSFKKILHMLDWCQMMNLEGEFEFRCSVHHCVPLNPNEPTSRQIITESFTHVVVCMHECLLEAELCECRARRTLHFDGVV